MVNPLHLLSLLNYFVLIIPGDLPQYYLPTRITRANVAKFVDGAAGNEKVLALIENSTTIQVAHRMTTKKAGWRLQNQSSFGKSQSRTHFEAINTFINNHYQNKVIRFCNSMRYHFY